MGLRRPAEQMSGRRVSAGVAFFYVAETIPETQESIHARKSEFLVPADEEDRSIVLQN